jgi:membrane associated rhomboid family serine protease
VEPNQNQQTSEHSHATKRQPVLNLPMIVTAFIAVCFVAHLVRVYLLNAEQNFLALYYGAFIPARLSIDQHSLESVTSTVSYSFLHGSFAHLLNNCLWLAVFGSPLANTIGAIRFILFWAVCSIIAALFHYIGQPSDMTPMIGASGAIAGLMGAAARFGFVMNRQTGMSRFEPAFPPLHLLVRDRSVLTFLAMFLISNLLVGSAQFNDTGASIAWQAHIGGVIAGFLLIPMFLPAKPLL